MGFPSRSTRYLTWRIGWPTLLALGLYSFLLLTNHFFVVAGEALRANAPAVATLHLFLLGVPQVIVFTIPMAVLLGTLVALGRLAADNEWIAFQAAGFGPSTLLRPVILIGLIATLIGFVLSAELVPRARVAGLEIRETLAGSSDPSTLVQAGVFHTLGENDLLFAKAVRRSPTRRLEGVLLVQEDSVTETTLLTVARNATLRRVSDRSIAIDFLDGEVRQYGFDADAEYRLTRFEQLTLTFRIPRDRLRPTGSASAGTALHDLTLVRLWAEYRLARAARSSASAEPPATEAWISTRNRERAAAVELHRRIAVPASSLFVSLVALPLGIRWVRTGKTAGVVISLVVLIAYRVIFVVGSYHATEGELPAAVGVWLANGALFVVAILGLWLPGRGRGANVVGAGPGAVNSSTPTRLRQHGLVTQISKFVLGQPVPNAGGWRLVGHIDRYVASHYLRILLVSVIVAYVTYGLAELPRLVRGVLRTNGSFWMLLDYYPHFMTGVLPMVLPVACLISAVAAVVALARNTELVPMVTAGMSLRRVTVPVIVLTLILGGFLFVIEAWVSPNANRRAFDLKDSIMGRRSEDRTSTENGYWAFDGVGQTLYHYQWHDWTKSELLRLNVFSVDYSTARIHSHRYSPRGVRADGEWRLEPGWCRTFRPDHFESKCAQTGLAVDVESLFYTSNHSAMGDNLLRRRFSAKQIRGQLSALRLGGHDTARLQLLFHRQFSVAFAPLVMVMLGLPLAFQVGRNGSLSGVGVALLLAVTFWACLAVFHALGYEALLPPTFAAWAPNVLFALLGGYLLLSVRT